MKACAIFLLIILLGTACAKSPQVTPVYEMLNKSEGLFPVQYEFTDVPSERRIELTFQNKLGQAVCFYPHFWPYPSGGVVNYSPWAPVLLIGKDRFPIEKVAGEYCPGCALLVAPAETVRASIPYEAFHVPDELVNAKKDLEFIPKAFRCKKR